MIFQTSGPNFRALQILQDAKDAIFFFCREPKALDVTGMVDVGTVREVQAGDIHSEAKQISHGGLGMAGRTDGADDLGAAGRGRCVEDIRGHTSGGRILVNREFWLFLFHECEIRSFGPDELF